MKVKDTNKGEIFGIFRSKYARSLAKDYIPQYFWGLLILMIIDIAQTEVPVVLGSTIDFIADSGFNSTVIRSQLLRLAIIAIIVFIGRIVWRYLIFGSAREIEKNMRNDLYRHLQTMSAGYFQEHNAGEIMAYMTSDIEAVRMVFAVTIMMGLDSLTVGGSTLYRMITQIDPMLTLAASLPTILVALEMTVMGKHLHKKFTLRQEAFAELSDFVQEKLSGMKVIKAFVQEDAENAAFEKVNKKTEDANIAEAKMQAFMSPFMRMVTGLSMGIAIGYGGYLAIIGRISVGEFSSFLMLLNMIVWPMASIGRIINLATRGSASLARLEKVLNAEPEIYDRPEASDKGPVSGSIEAKNLTFRYSPDEEPVLNNISFKLEKGQTLGIVGRTGSGKSSFVNLLMRVFESEDNMLYIGGREIHSIPLHQLRKTIGYVPQDSFLFSDTVYGNISFGNRNKSREEVINAAKSACVHENIMDFADGYNTLIGERGVSISGGQKQRIAIARALILDPEILILDDSLSAVDTDTEEQILRHLNENRRGKTNIIIAHRISTLQNADKILVIDEGRIAEEGTHSELLKMNGIYADMYNRQLLEKMKKEEFAL